MSYRIFTEIDKLNIKILKKHPQIASIKALIYRGVSIDEISIRTKTKKQTIEKIMFYFCYDRYKLMFGKCVLESKKEPYHSCEEEMNIIKNFKFNSSMLNRKMPFEKSCKIINEFNQEVEFINVSYSYDELSLTEKEMYNADSRNKIESSK
jgi:hypothetical protein